MTIRPNTSLLARFRTLLAGTFLLLAILTPPTAFAEEETPTPIAEVEGITQFEAMLAKAEEFVAAGDDAEWSDFVTEDADTAWGLISGLAGSEDSAIVDGETVGVGEYVTEKLNGASAEVNKAIYDNVWSNADALTPWLTHNIWVLIAAFLVFIMHLGFATLESGLCQKKNTVNILFKNCWIISVGILLYFLWGFNAHYPGWDNGFFPIGSSASYGANELLTHATNLYNSSYTWWTDFIFQAMFAATAATIVSGAVAERAKLSSFLIFSAILVGFAYPWVGSWHWGSGFLANLKEPFYDFAGSTVVHAFGGFAALACVLVLGPRRGKYTKNGIKPILGHSMPLAAIGAFLLFLGWFGFNGGSVLAAEPHLVSLVFVTTALAAVGGALGAMLIAWIVTKKPDLSMALNGFLAGLVGITAGADAISPTMSILVGLIAGAIVVFSVIMLDKLKIDDPVGAISVHGTCGIWGTLAVAFFGGANLASQVIGIAAVCGFAFVFSLVVFGIIKVAIGVRVEEEEEVQGLDVAEHGVPAYGAESAEM